MCDLNFINNILKSNESTKDITITSCDDIVYNYDEIFIHNKNFKIVINKNKVILYKTY